MAFKQMENIGNFLDGCETVGVNREDLFQTVDLYEGENMAQVVNGIYALGGLLSIIKNCKVIGRRNGIYAYEGCIVWGGGLMITFIFYYQFTLIS